MDPKTGAIKKIGFINSFLCPNDLDSDCEGEKTNYSYKLKIKHVCPPCEIILHAEIIKREIKPLHYAELCYRCLHKSVHQPYAKLCSLCSRFLRVCTNCLEPYNEIDTNPFRILLTESAIEELKYLPEDIQRTALRYVFKKWEKYEKGLISRCGVQMGLERLLNYLRNKNVLQI